MSLTFTLQKEHIWCLGVFGASFLINFWQAFSVGRARKQYHVEYPAMYAAGKTKDAVAFNCVQRAHQNYLENWIPIMALMFANSVFFPFASAACGAIWLVGRVVYAIGYKTGAANRMYGGILQHFGDLPLLVMFLYGAGKAVKGTF